MDVKLHGYRRELLGCLGIATVLVASLGAVETLSQRRRQLDGMSAEQLDDLIHNEEQFRKLSQQERQRIRELHEQIEIAPDREKLRATMNRYCKWFETQLPYRQAKLSEDRKKTVKERVATVKEFLALDLDDKDRRSLAAWLDQYITEHGPRFVENLGPGSHTGFSRLPPERQKVFLRQMFLRRWPTGGPGGQIPPLSEPEMARLLAGLSAKPRTMLETKKPAERDRIIVEWLRETAFQEVQDSQELDEQLASFFESPAIDAKERDRLMSLPSDKMLESLNEQYRAYSKQSKSGDHPPWPRGRRPNAPKGTGDRRQPEDRDEKDSHIGKGVLRSP